MSKSQLLQYLHDCLDGERRQSSGDGLVDLAQALSYLMLATRGLEVNLSAADRVALDRQWGQPELSDGVIRAAAEIKRHPPDAETFVNQSVKASFLVGRNPAGEDAEQAAKVRLLAAASIAFQMAKKQSVADVGLDHLVAEIDDGQWLPGKSDTNEPVQSWLERTLNRLRNYNPYADEEGEDLRVLDSLLDDDPPTLLAEWVR